MKLPDKEQLLVLVGIGIVVAMFCVAMLMIISLFMQP